MKAKILSERPETLVCGPMHYAPENELGVVFLFAHLAKRWRLRIDVIRPNFPDCIAYQKAGGKEKPIRIEFEFKSRNFAAHKHKAKQCDWLVCWEHNWPAVPDNIHVVELRREFGLGFNVWLMPVQPKYQDDLDKYPSGEWSVPGQAHKNDLLLFYCSGTGNKCFRYVYRCLDRAHYVSRAAWKRRVGIASKTKSDFRAPMRRVSKLEAPVFLEDLRRHPVLKTAGFVRGDMRGRMRITEYWPYLYEMMVRRNPRAKGTLRKFAPERG
jgi:hypothetical protein